MDETIMALDIFFKHDGSLLLDVYQRCYEIFTVKNQYIRHLLTVYDCSLKICSFIRKKREKIKQKISTVATYANDLDSALAKETNNFEYDDHEWDVGIGNLIINLDADIEKTQIEKLNSENGMDSTTSESSLNKIKNLDNQNYSFNENISHSNNIQLPSVVSTSSTTSPVATCKVITQSYNLVNVATAAKNNSSKVSTTIINKVNSDNNILEADIHDKMTVEHSAIVDKGLKMKIKRTKSGCKSSEAKHEIVKSNEANELTLIKDIHGITNNITANNSSSLLTTSSTTHNIIDTQSSPSHHTIQSSHTVSNEPNFDSVKKNISNHCHEKTRDKYDKLKNNRTLQETSDINRSKKQNTQNPSYIKAMSEFSSLNTRSTTSLTSSMSTVRDHYLSPINFAKSSSASTTSPSISNSNSSTDIPCSSSGNNADAQKLHESMFRSKSSIFPISQNIEMSDNLSTYLTDKSATVSTDMNINNEQKSCTTNVEHCLTSNNDEKSDVTDSPPIKKSRSFFKKDSKEMSDICVGTSVGTITEPDCLGPCEPGTSVTLEGIVWHETDEGVLVVNITWRGKTYVGTLLDCTRHDWAPPRFCDSPISDLDLKSSKGRIKRGRASTNTSTSNDLINFTETRSSVHSKLRKNGSKTKKGTHGSPTVSPYTAPFVSPRADTTVKRKTRCFEEDEKSKKKVTNTLLNISPPASPMLLECPEPNCYKKYKHINGLKYHQSHTHGLIVDDDLKEGVTSMSENDESNTEAPSPVISIKSPTEKVENIPNTFKTLSTNVLEHSLDETSLPIQLPYPDIQSQSTQQTNKNVMNEAVTKSINKDRLESNKVVSTSIHSSSVEPQFESETHDSEGLKCLSASSIQLNKSSPTLLEKFENPNLVLSPPNLQSDHKITPSQPNSNRAQGENSQNLFVYSENKSVCSENEDVVLNNTDENKSTLQELSKQTPSSSSIINQLSNNTLTDSADISNIHTTSNLQPFSNESVHTKFSHFKVKPTADLMPEDDKMNDSKAAKTASFKKKIRKSPVNSPHQSSLEALVVDTEREDVQSPAYSDISDDATPSEAATACEKLVKHNQGNDLESCTQSNLTSHFSIYPYLSQSSYLIKSTQEKAKKESKNDESANKIDSKSLNAISLSSLIGLETQNPDKDNKDCSSSHISSQMQGHYYTNYNTYMSAGYSLQGQVENCSSLKPLTESELVDQKQRMKQESDLQILNEKHLENQQIIKENLEIRNQMSPYQLYHNSQSHRPSSTVTGQSEDRKFYIYSSEQSHKDDSEKQNVTQKGTFSSKDHEMQDKIQDANTSDESKIKLEGVKPTMETHGPPPPPTSQYTYIHPGYIPAHHYSNLSFDPSHHAMYRNLNPMIISGAYANNPYLHQLPRYAAEDLSRSPNGKSIDIMQHHANSYYPSHKIHELQQRAINSPISKNQVASSNSLLTVQPPSIKSPNDISNNSLLENTTGSFHSSLNNKQQNQNTGQQQPQQHSNPKDSNSNSTNKDSNRSPPPQRHVHTHHHTHVGLGYPILPGQYPGPYSAVLASQQAAAVAASVISPFPPK